MSISAMKQALEALEEIHRTGDTQAFDLCYAPNVIPALRQAIAEAEKLWVKTYAGGKPNYTTSLEKQEPVAWHEPGAYGNVTTHKDWALANGWEPLYAALVHASDMSQERVDETAKRKHEWEELDVNEVIELIHEHITNLTPELTGELYGLVAAIDMRLQEKNHG